LINGDPSFCQQDVCCNMASCAGTGGIGGECRRCNRAASLGTRTADTGVAVALMRSTAMSGFVSDNICQRFADNTTGLCDNTGTCIKTDTQRCIDNAVPRTGLFTCGTVNRSLPIDAKTDDGTREAPRIAWIRSRERFCRIKRHRRRSSRTARDL
jgi:hypothetical protein